MSRPVLIMGYFLCEIYSKFGSRRRPAHNWGKSSGSGSLESKTYTKLIRDEYYKMRKDMND
jgi:hypothetical protein